MKREAGFTLIELIVVLAIVAVSLTVASLSLGSQRESGEAVTVWEARLIRSRAQAIEGGRPVVVMPDSGNASGPVLFLPDGRAVGADVDPLTGAVLAR
jgi:prepilin-type N-terminal cleavage/methylation domain-containing protein